MKNIVFIIFVSILFSACLKLKHSGSVDKWNGAQWIGYEKLEDSLKVIPGVHLNGDHLGNKCLKRSIIPMFRKEFNINSEIEKATVHVSGLGHYELSLNGSKVGNLFLAP